MILCSDPHAQYLAYKDEIDTAVRSVLDSGNYLFGPETEGFEKAFADYVGVNHCLGVGNGTDAIEIALKACGIGAGDEVITVSHTATATVSAITQAGATPVYADIDEKTFTLDTGWLQRLVTEKTKAIVPVHLYGHPAAMEDIMAFARMHDLYVIEDCAQSHGATIGDAKAGSIGDLACFSFYPTKNLSALGDAGAIVGNDIELMGKCGRLRQYGWEQRFISVHHGTNSRMDEVQAAVLRVKLGHLDETTQERIKLAGRYRQELSALDIVLPEEREDCRHVYHLFVIRTADRDRLLTWLQQQGIGAAIHYPVPVHQQPGYSNACSLPVTERYAEEILTLPLYPEMGDRIDKVIDAVKGFFEQ